MTDSSAEPEEYDAILGGQVSPLAGIAILGGLEGVKRRLASASIEQKMASLPDTLQYGRAGFNLLAQIFQEDRSWQVRRVAYWLLKTMVEPGLRQTPCQYNPYREFCRVRTIDIRTIEISQPGALSDTDFINDLIVSPTTAENEQLLAVSSSKTTQIRTLSDGALLHTIPDYGSLAITRDGRTLVVGSGSYEGKISLWDLATGKLQRILPFDFRGAGVDAVAIAPNGEMLVSASNNRGKVKVWQLHSGKLLYTRSGYKPTVVNPNGQNFAARQQDGSIKIWSLHSGTLLRSIAGQGKEVTAIAISPNGHTLASGSWDGTIYLWHLLTGDLIEAIVHSRQGAPIAALAISPDGHVLASSCRYGSVKLWDLRTGENLRNLANYPDWICSVAFSSDGETILLGSWKAQVDLWSIR